MKLNRMTLSGGALGVLAILLVAVLLIVNVLFRGARLDLTQSHLYTLSSGTKNVLASIDEPVHLYLYFSDKGTATASDARVQGLRTYFQRVREMLDEMAARSGSKLKVDVIDPLPFSEDEDRATALGVQSIPLGPGGTNLFFGLAGTNSTNGQAVIAFLDPGKESFLEYDVAKLVHDLTTTKKPVVGVLSSLPLGSGFDPATRQMREPWAIDQQLQQLFEVRQLNAAQLKAIDKDLSVVAVVHPKQLSDDAQYALDQFVLRGGHLLVFVDPNAETDDAGADPNNPQAAMMADKSSDLPKLFKAWGVDYDAKQIVLDRARALPITVSPQQAPVRHPAILGLTAADLNKDDVLTASLESINVSTAGAFALAKDAKDTKLIPLLQSTGEAMLVPADRMRFMPDPSALLEGYKESGEHYVIAGRLEGKFKSAFPERKEEGHLAEAKEVGQVVLVADTDILTNRLWVQIQNFYGQKVMNAFANNGDFAVNAVDNLTGSSDLISIRGRATSQRPFTRVDNLKRVADTHFRETEQGLQRELADTERKLTQLQSAKSKDQAMILSPEQKTELESFMKRKLEIRKELRQVRRGLDAEIESLGTGLKLANIVLMPLLVTLAAIGFGLWRSKRRRAI